MDKSINRPEIFKRSYHNSSWLIALVTFFMLSSCGNEYWSDNVDCSQCYTPKPTTGVLFVNITINAENTKVPIKIYKGKFQESYLRNDDQALIIDTVSIPYYQADLDVNEYYSVAVEYNENGKKVMVVDGDKMNMYHVSSACDQECWIIKGGNIDATLKK
jgi:hypothetical protein